MIPTAQSRVFVDGNNVMGSRPDSWWRDRAGATRRLVAEIIPLALDYGGRWTIVFDGREPPRMPLSPECLTVVHNGHGRPDGAYDRIVELVHEHPHRAASLVYTSDAKLHIRLKALGIQVRGSGALLNQIATVPGAMKPSAAGHPCRHIARLNCAVNHGCGHPPTAISVCTGSGSLCPRAERAQWCPRRWHSRGFPRL